MKWEDVCRSPFATEAEKRAFWRRINEEQREAMTKQRAEEEAARQERFARGEDTEKDRYHVLLKAQAAERAALEQELEAKLHAAAVMAAQKEWEAETRKRMRRIPIPKRKKWN